MLQQVDSDDDDDYEGYFLQPAQSYDIAEKIKLANQELDETPLPTTPINRVVRFRSVLEDYEPEYSSNSKPNENFEAETFDIIVEEIVEEIQEVIINEVVINEVATVEELDEQFVEELEDPIEKQTEQEINVVLFQETSPSDDERPTPESTCNSEVEAITGQPIQEKPQHKTTIRRQFSKPLTEVKTDCRRMCCHSKKLDKQALPKYNGFYSEYGLTKEQLDRRHQTIEARMQQKFNRRIQKTNEKNNKLNMNEQAFASWLYKKIKNPFNGNKNMYNCKVNTKK